MKVLMISKSLVSGAYHGKLRELVAAGVDLSIVVPPRWGGERLEISEAQDYQINVLPCALSGHNHCYFYWPSLDYIDADLVHLDEEPWSVVTYQFIRKTTAQRIPVVFFTWQNIKKKYPFPFGAIEKYTYRHADAAIAGNTEARDVLITKGFSRDIAVIPQLGVDPDFFTKRNAITLRTRFNLVNRFVIGYVGRIIHEKGICNLIEALSYLPTHCILVLLGDGDFIPNALRLAQRLHVADRIRWIARVPSLEVPEYMNLFDVLVLPSLTTRSWKEQFGRVLIEAMACGVPPVGSSSGEIPQVIGEAGLVFPEGDTRVLADHLLVLCEQEEMRLELGRKARARVIDKFTHRRIAQETVQVYSQVLSQPRAVGQKAS